MHLADTRPRDQTISSLTCLPTTLLPAPLEIVSDLPLFSYVLLCCVVTIFTSSSVSYSPGVGFYLISFLVGENMSIFGHVIRVE